MNHWLFFSPSVLAVTQVKLFDLAERDCPPKFVKGSVTSGGRAMAANCFLIAGKAENKMGKPLVKADVFSRVYNSNHDPVIQNRTRLGSIEIPPGISDFQLQISVPTD